MSDDVKRIRIFVASPGDVSAERDAIGAVVQELNTTIAPYKHFTLELVRCETHATPAVGRPQGIINEQIGDYDIFVGIMWKRFGSPTGVAESGTEEEFRVAYDCWKNIKSVRILFYFCQSPFMPRTLEETKQFQRVLEFRHELSPLALTWEYSGIAEFPNVVRPHLARILLDMPTVERDSDQVVQYEYDSLGRLSKLTDPDAGETTIYTYDAANRLASITEPQDGQITSYEYDANGNLVRASKAIQPLPADASVFIACASDDLRIAESVETILTDAGFSPVRWDKHVFPPGRTMLEAFEDLRTHIDAAIVIIGAQPNRDKPSGIMFEAGMLHGILGRRRLIVMSPRTHDLPSDLLGTIYVPFALDAMDALKPKLLRELEQMKNP